MVDSFKSASIEGTKIICFGLLWMRSLFDIRYLHPLQNLLNFYSVCWLNRKLWAKHWVIERGHVKSGPGHFRNYWYQNQRHPMPNLWQNLRYIFEHNLLTKYSIFKNDKFNCERGLSPAARYVQAIFLIYKNCYCGRIWGWMIF